MSNGVQKVNRRSERPLRFALYGRAHAGKTCYLGALAIEQRVGNPRGYTSDWIYSPDVCPVPPVGCDSPEDINKWLAQLPEVDAQFAGGKIWLDGAKEAMTNGKIQPPTNIAAMHRYRFVFRGRPFAPLSPRETGDAGTVQARNYQIELVDYSGELTDPGLRDEDFVKRVRDHLRECDGLVVLAEVPQSAQSLADQYQNFSRLRVAFESIRKSKLEAGELCPIALVVNKGDRLMAGDQYDPSRADARLASFFASEPEPAHRQLQEVLRSAVPPDRYRAFLASAFGKSRTIQTRSKSGVIIPEDVPEFDKVLKSYGLEDPFIWLASQHERICLERLTKRVGELVPWKVWQLADKSHRNFHKDANGFLSATNDSAEARARVRNLVSQAGWVAAQQVGVLVLAIGLLFAAAMEGATALADRGAISAAVPLASIAFPAPKEIETMKATIAWYGGFKAPSWRRLFSHSFLSSAALTEERMRALSERVLVEEIAQNINNANSEDTLAIAEKEVTELAKVPLSDSSQAFVDQLSRMLATQKQLIATIANDASFHNAYGQARANGDLLQQALVLNKQWNKLGEHGRRELRECQDEFKRSLPAALRASVERLVLMENWAGAVLLVNQVVSNPDIKALKLEESTLSAVARERESYINRKREKYYYDRIVVAQGNAAKAAAIQDYLSKVPKETANERALGRVEQYRQYLDRFETELDYNLRLVSIWWGTSKPGFTIHIAVNVNGSDAFPDVTGVTKKNDSTEFQEKPATIHGTLNTELTISAKAEVRSDGASRLWVNRGSWGHGSQTVRLSDLLKDEGVSITFTDGYEQKLNLRITDCPVPLLPRYEILAGQ